MIKRETLGSNVLSVVTDMYELFVKHNYKEIKLKDNNKTMAKTKKVTTMNRPFLSGLRTPFKSAYRVFRRWRGTGGFCWLTLKSGKVVRFRADNVKWVSGVNRKLSWDTPPNARLKLVAIPDLNDVVTVVVLE